MERRNQVALGIVLLLGVTVFFLYRAPERGERVGERARPVPKLAKEQIKKVTLTSKGKTVTLQRRKERWYVTTPADSPADKYASETLQRKLEELTFGDLITERKEKHAAFEVGADKAVRVQVSDDKTVLADFYLGKAETGFTMFRKHGEDKVYQAVGFLRSTFDKEARLWRDRRILAAKREDVRQVEFVTAAGTATLKRSGPKAAWTVENTPVPLPKLDEGAINNALAALQSLSAYDFDDTISAEDAGLEPPQASITLSLEGGSKVKLLVGKKGKEHTWVKGSAQSQIFIVKHHSLKSLVLRPVDLKDKTVLTFDKDKLLSVHLEQLQGASPQRVLLERKDLGWTGNGKKIASIKKITAAVKTLSKLKAHAFAQHQAEELGLTNPLWRLTLKLADGSTHVLQVGGVNKEGSHGAQIDGSEDIFLLRKHTLDQFLLEPSKFQ
ncbi:MAG: DUF4340 domain-containing protein [Deltaproteobacteria bacterium]|nr:DUF4340 domain-containing protein [Deltaproteobacteria bacterium]